MEEYITRYFLSHESLGEAEVSKKQFINSEQAAGFRSKFGSDHCATGGFSWNGLSGRIETTKIKGDESDV